MNLDYTLKTSEERVSYVNEQLSVNPTINDSYKQYIADYILFVNDKHQTKNEHKQKNPIITRNREITVNKRQTSFEEMVDNLENGEDGIYALITNDRNKIMDPKDTITQKEIESNPALQKQITIINSLKRQFKNATGQARYSLKRQIIESWQQIYILRTSIRGEATKGHPSNQLKTMAHMPLDENITFNSKGIPQSDCIITLFNPDHVSFLLCYYPQLKEECWDDLHSDMHYLLFDLENLALEALKDYPVLLDLLVWKIDGLSNEQIKEKMDVENNIRHNEQYFSTLWRKRIPKLISEKAQEQYVNWFYSSQDYGKYKTCGKCGQTKLAHPLFFSRNNSSKDGFYSVCKDCRAKLQR